ncbi:30S ribosomal protein S8 [Candidatus Pacearchaeota archaeon]|nr:30S ribosomal protein S8 [uncultured archaeon]MBS3075510.1 30S ribosomal protein S8 [Candidatus Pacearchaeota archaeon]
MSQDIISDVLNEIMNAKRARKTELIVNKNSRLLRNVLDIAKEAGYIDYSVEGRNIKIKIENLNEFKAIKPRYTVSVGKINNYVRRYLPAKNFGFLIISTNKGLVKHNEAEDKNLGGCLIAYVY